MLSQTELKLHESYGEINFHYILSLLPFLLAIFLSLQLFYEAVSPIQVT